jgi:hypothetical protein
VSCSSVQSERLLYVDDYRTIDAVLKTGYKSWHPTAASYTLHPKYSPQKGCRGYYLRTDGKGRLRIEIQTFGGILQVSLPPKRRHRLRGVLSSHRSWQL